MENNFWNWKIAWIFIIAIIVQALFAIGLASTHQPLLSLEGDSLDYLRTAQNFLYKGIWSASSLASPQPDNFRTPLYPLFIIPFLHFKIPLAYISLLQSLLVVVVAVLTYYLGRRIVSDRTAFIAALAIALEPYIASTFIAKVLMTEVFATVLIFITFWNFIRYIQSKEWYFLAWGSGMLALAALTKPQFFFFFLIIPVAMWCAGEIKVWKKMLGALALFGLIVSPWLYYNFFVLHVPQFSSVTLIAVFDSAYRVRNWQTGGADPQYHGYYVGLGEKILGVTTPAELYEPYNAKRLADIGFAEVKAHPIAFAWYQLIHIPRIFYHEVNTEAVAKDFALSYNTGPGEVDVNVLKALIHGHISDAWQMLKKYPAWIVSLTLKVLLILIAPLAFGYIWIKRVYNGVWDMPAIFILGVIAVYAVLASPVGQHRYRVPIEPWLYLFAFESIRLLYQRLRKNPS